MKVILLKILVATALIGPGIYLKEPLLIILTAPIAALIFSPDLLNFCIGSFRAMRHHAFKGDARVYQYGYYQVRLIEWQGRPWFSAVPVCGALGHHDVEAAINYYATTDYCIYGTKKEQFLTAQAVMRLAKLSRHPDATNFLNWFEKDVLGTLPDELRRRARLGPPGAGATPAPEKKPSLPEVRDVTTIPVDPKLRAPPVTKLDIEL
jgi:hypothetical protein